MPKYPCRYCKEMVFYNRITHLSKTSCLECDRRAAKQKRAEKKMRMQP